MMAVMSLPTGPPLIATSLDLTTFRKRSVEKKGSGKGKGSSDSGAAKAQGKGADKTEDNSGSKVELSDKIPGDPRDMFINPDGSYKSEVSEIKGSKKDTDTSKGKQYDSKSPGSSTGESPEKATAGDYELGFNPKSQDCESGYEKVPISSSDSAKSSTSPEPVAESSSSDDPIPLVGGKVGSEPASSQEYPQDAAATGSDYESAEA